MSRITTIEKIDKSRNNRPDEAPATYCTFEIDGEKFLQIDTYGSPNRKCRGQPSQKIQFNEQFAKELVAILIKEFRE